MWATGILTGLTFPVCILIIKWKAQAYKKKIKESDFDKLNFYRPTAQSVMLEASMKEDQLAIGGAVQVSEALDLYSGHDITRIGWQPKDVKIKDLEKDFNASDIYDAANKEIPNIQEANGKKFCLAHIKHPLSDEPFIKLSFEETRYYTVQGVIDDVKHNHEFRMAFTSTDPKEHKIPNAFCLHYLAEFSDENVLVFQRAAGLGYYEGKISFSGEEQMAKVDMENEFDDIGATLLFQRAVIEEIFPIAKKPLDSCTKDVVSKFYKLAEQHVESMRAFSVFMESEISNFAMMGYIKLNLTIDQYRETYRRFVQDGSPASKEGNLHYTNIHELERLLITHECNIYELKSEQPVLIKSEDLHPTSRYRIIQFLLAKKIQDVTNDFYIRELNVKFGRKKQ